VFATGAALDACANARRVFDHSKLRKGNASSDLRETGMGLSCCVG
jgi:hypothetical protein